jgi:hypothetical protein
MRSTDVPSIDTGIGPNLLFCQHDSDISRSRFKSLSQVTSRRNMTQAERTGVVHLRLSIIRVGVRASVCVPNAVDSGSVCVGGNLPVWRDRDTWCTDEVEVSLD